MFGKKTSFQVTEWVAFDVVSYQLPPLITKKTAVVISPLISLMQDQVYTLSSLCEEFFVTSCIDILHLLALFNQGCVVFCVIH